MVVAWNVAEEVTFIVPPNNALPMARNVPDAWRLLAEAFPMRSCPNRVEVPMT